jgi:hypothetical protein
VRSQQINKAMEGLSGGERQERMRVVKGVSTKAQLEIAAAFSLPHRPGSAVHKQSVVSPAPKPMPNPAGTSVPAASYLQLLPKQLGETAAPGATTSIAQSVRIDPCTDNSLRLGKEQMKEPWVKTQASKGMDFWCEESDQLDALACQKKCAAENKCENAVQLCKTLPRCVGVAINKEGNWATLKCCDQVTKEQIDQNSLQPSSRQAKWCGTCQEGKYDCRPEEQSAGVAYIAADELKETPLPTAVPTSIDSQLAKAKATCSETLSRFKKTYSATGHSPPHSPRGDWKEGQKKCRGRALLWSWAKLFVIFVSISSEVGYLINCEPSSNQKMALLSVHVRLLGPTTAVPRATTLQESAAAGLVWAFTYPTLLPGQYRILTKLAFFGDTSTRARTNICKLLDNEPVYLGGVELAMGSKQDPRLKACEAACVVGDVKIMVGTGGVSQPKEASKMAMLEALRLPICTRAQTNNPGHWLRFPKSFCSSTSESEIFDEPCRFNAHLKPLDESSKTSPLASIATNGVTVEDPLKSWLWWWTPLDCRLRFYRQADLKKRLADHGVKQIVFHGDSMVRELFVAARLSLGDIESYEDENYAIKKSKSNKGSAGNESPMMLLLPSWDDHPDTMKLHFANFYKQQPPQVFVTNLGLIHRPSRAGSKHFEDAVLQPLAEWLQEVPNCQRPDTALFVGPPGLHGYRARFLSHQRIKELSASASRILEGCGFKPLLVAGPGEAMPEATWDGLHYADMPTRVYAMALWNAVIGPADAP